MKYLNHISKIITAFVLLMVFGACSFLDLDVNKNPNAPSGAAPDLLLTNIQVNMFSNLAGIEGDAEAYVGIMGTASTSRWDLQTTNYDGVWQSLYNSSAKDLEALIAAATEQNSPHYLGIAQTLKAYLFMTLVDLFGDVPFSEASQGDAAKKITSPKYDKDAEIYAACLKLLDDAIVNFGKTSAVSVAGDNIYGGNIARWTKAARSLKLKFLMTARKGISGADTEIKNLLATPANLIATEAEDFNFRFSRDPISVRHTYYTGAYTGGEFDWTYLCNQFLIEMLLDNDPRYNLYFRHQTNRILDLNNATDRGTISPGYVPLSRWADSLRARGYTQAFINGIFGRERGDASGIPADGSLRTIPGVYPCGGFANVPVTASSGISVPAANAAPGGGIFPALTGVNILYYQLESILALGGTGNARDVFKAAMEAHMARVYNFSSTVDPTNTSVNFASVGAFNTARDAYVARWLARFDAAPDNNAKLNVVMKQLWFSSFGNGFEIYNAYRRTGFPNTIADLLVPSPKGATSYIHRWPYPLSELNLNKSMSDAQKNVKYWVDKVFWNK